MNIQKNQIFTVKITDMGIDGEGIGHLEDSGALSGNGYTLFVKDAVLGDTVRAKVVKPKKGYAFARLEEVLEPSPGLNVSKEKIKEVLARMELSETVRGETLTLEQFAQLADLLRG